MECEKIPFSLDSAKFNSITNIRFEKNNNSPKFVIIEKPLSSLPVSYTHLDVYKRQGVVGLAYTDTSSKGTCNSAIGGTNAYCWGSAGNTTNFRDASKAQVVLSFNKTF